MLPPLVVATTRATVVMQVVFAQHGAGTRRMDAGDAADSAAAKVICQEMV